MQYYSSQHQTLLPSPVTSTTGHCFCFHSISSFFLELFLHSSPVTYWAPTDQWSSSFSVLELTSAGNQREELHPWQRSWGRRLGIHKGRIQPQESPWKFSSIYSQNQSLPTLLLCALTYTSDFTGGCPPTTSLWKRVNLQLQLIKFLGVTRVFQPTNSFGSPLACLNRFFRPHVIVHSLPTIERHEMF